MDYGNTQTVPLSFLTKLNRYESQLPAQAMRCCLTCVRPSVAFTADGEWPEAATARLNDLVRDKRLQAKVSGREGT